MTRVVLEQRGGYGIALVRERDGLRLRFRVADQPVFVEAFEGALVQALGGTPKPYVSLKHSGAAARGRLGGSRIRRTSWSSTPHT